MIGIYVDKKLHEEIKTAARGMNSSIKEYFLSLHRLHMGEAEKTDRILGNTERILDILTDSIRPEIGYRSNIASDRYRSERMRESSASTRDTKVKNQILNKNPPPRRSSSSSKINKSDYSDLPPVLETYLEQFQKFPRQYSALKETLLIILRYGGTVTSSVLKKERGMSRTTLIKGQVDRLVTDEIISKDDSQKPYTVTLLS